MFSKTFRALFLILLIFSCSPRELQKNSSSIPKEEELSYTNERSSLNSGKEINLRDNLSSENDTTSSAREKLSDLWYIASSEQWQKSKEFISFSSKKKMIFLMSGDSIRPYQWLWTHASEPNVEILGKAVYSKKQIQLHIRFEDRDTIIITSYTPNTFLSNSITYKRLHSSDSLTENQEIPKLRGVFKGVKSEITFQEASFSLKDNDSQKISQGLWTLFSLNGILILQLGFIDSYRQIYRQKNYKILYTKQFQSKNQETFRFEMTPVHIEENGRLQFLPKEEKLLLEKTTLQRIKAGKK